MLQVEVWRGTAHGRVTGTAIDQANVTGPGSFLRFLGRELDPLALAQQLEHRAAD